MDWEYGRSVVAFVASRSQNTRQWQPACGR